MHQAVGWVLVSLLSRSIAEYKFSTRTKVPYLTRGNKTSRIRETLEEYLYR